MVETQVLGDKIVSRRTLWATVALYGCVIASAAPASYPQDLAPFEASPGSPFHLVWSRRVDFDELAYAPIHTPENHALIRYGVRKANAIDLRTGRDLWTLEGWMVQNMGLQSVRAHAILLTKSEVRCIRIVDGTITASAPWQDWDSLRAVHLHGDLMWVESRVHGGPLKLAPFPWTRGIHWTGNPLEGDKDLDTRGSVKIGDILLVATWDTVRAVSVENGGVLWTLKGPGSFSAIVPLPGDHVGIVWGDDLVIVRGSTGEVVSRADGLGDIQETYPNLMLSVVRFAPWGRRSSLVDLLQWSSEGIRRVELDLATWSVECTGSDSMYFVLTARGPDRTLCAVDRSSGNIVWSKKVGGVLARHRSRLWVRAQWVVHAEIWIEKEWLHIRIECHDQATGAAAGWLNIGPYRFIPNPGIPHLPDRIADVYLDDLLIVLGDEQLWGFTLDTSPERK